MAASDLKYPRTFHLPGSPGAGSDDKRLRSYERFRGRRVVVTEKVDGECTTLTRERTYPRSLDGRYHPSRDWMKAFHARRAGDIPEGWRINGEYAYARHSVAYTRDGGNALRSYFYGFGVWNADNVLMGWDETIELFALLEIEPVEVLYDGPFHDRLVGELAAAIDPSKQEGFVMRDAGAIPWPESTGGAGRFLDGVAKWVRPGHVQTDAHWMTAWRNEPGFFNELREGVDPAP